MLAGARVAAVVPVSNLDSAIEFWQKLGLGTPELDEIPNNPGARFALGGGGELYVYESVGAGQSRATVAGFRVADIDSAVEELRARGVVFEEYDLPDLKTENGIVTIGDLRAAWAKDPDGNIIAFESRTS
jgi:catechol 2,3-dioxygenase-like lactoylglutathione lyase family enzyme